MVEREGVGWRESVEESVGERLVDRVGERESERGNDGVGEERLGRR